MSDVFFKELSIPRPGHQLHVGGSSHGAMTGRMLEGIEHLLQRELPDWVLVYGDTNSTIAGALAATKLHIPVAHVEAGLRSFNRRMPEEINRVLTDHASDLLFAPTETALTNLEREGLPPERIQLVGDVMYDALRFYQERSRPPEWFQRLSLDHEDFVLATVHRAENTDDLVRLRGIFDGLGECGRPVILPLHPRTRKIVAQLAVRVPENVHLFDPVGYLEMVWLVANAAVVATDSGGLQKEAYFLGKPCVTLRDETEWIELLAVGANTLVGSDSGRIASAISAAAHSPVSREELYGAGDAAARIVAAMFGRV